MSAFFHIQPTLKRLLNKFINSFSYQISSTWNMKLGGCQTDPPEKTIFKKPSLIRVKNDEKCFYFTLKAFFLLKIFKCLSWRLGYVEKQLD